MIPFFRFTIRDLLWLVTVIAVAAGWFASYRDYRYRESVFQERMRLQESEHQQLNSYWIGAQEAMDNAGIEWPPTRDKSP